MTEEEARPNHLLVGKHHVNPALRKETVNIAEQWLGDKEKGDNAHAPFFEYPQLKLIVDGHVFFESLRKTRDGSLV